MLENFTAKNIFLSQPTATISWRMFGTANILLNTLYGENASAVNLLLCIICTSI